MSSKRQAIQSLCNQIIKNTQDCRPELNRLDVLLVLASLTASFIAANYDDPEEARQALQSFELTTETCLTNLAAEFRR